MKLGMVTDSLAELTLAEAAKVCRDLGLEQVELGCGNWSPAPHVDLDLNQTLEDINYQIIQRILEEEHGNKEKTSRRLGISRSTLWRILKNRQAEE